MSHILTVVLDTTDQGLLSVNLFTSEGMPDQAALAAVQAVERQLQRRVLRAELEAERQEAAQTAEE